MNSDIRIARINAGLSGLEISHAVHKPSQWLGLVEMGSIELSPEDELVVLTAIGRLGRFRLTVAQAKQKLLADLHLSPEVEPTRANPRTEESPLMTCCGIFGASNCVERRSTVRAITRRGRENCFDSERFFRAFP